jgi:hypothetical protein
MISLLAVRPHNDKFSKYHSIEAYEIRPGILMIPRYSQDGQVCEMGLQRMHYSPEIVRFDSSLSRSEIDGLFDELVPADEERSEVRRFRIGHDDHDRP